MTFILLGDELVNIGNFETKGNQGPFNFYYCSNLGDFCKNIFNIIPPHNHYPFGAEVEKILTDKNVGCWKIKKKTVLKK